ncbi:MAG: DUF2179 domain-containing protein [Verrucomicrobiota bacterium JB024]|nr:DUF2179 domain-containing protein [Verrucomicrobiota bacterium JB024]
MDYIYSFDYVSWVIIPALIFIAKLTDVSMATLRHILIYRGMKKTVPILAFIEITIWLVAITQVMENLTNIASILAWSGGFSAGTYVGMWIEEKLALGYVLIRVIAQSNDEEQLRSRISGDGFGVTSVDADGLKGKVNVFLVISKRKRLKSVLAILSEFEPTPFYTIEDLRNVGTTPPIANWIPGAFSTEANLKKR